MNGAEIFIPLSLFATVFGVFYLYFTSRHRERMALIEKGENASLFQGDMSEIKKSRRFFLLSFALTLMGVGAGIVIATILYNITNEDAVYPACIFFMAGAGLLASFLLTKEKQEY